MMFGDDACSTISSTTMLSEFGGDGDGSDDGEDAEVFTELKYVPPAQQSGKPEIDVSGFKQVVIKVERVKRVADEDDEEEEAPLPSQKYATRKKKRAGLRDHLSLKEKRALETKQRRANMTPEQKEKAKERERLRKQKERALKRTRREEEMAEEEDGGKKRRPPSKRRSVAKVKTEVDVKSEVDEDEEEMARKRRSATSGGRKKRSEMSEGELEAARAKWREEARLKRALQREQMTEEEREAMLQKQREQRRKSREKARLTMTPEQRREEAQRESLRRLEKLAGMTEEERRTERMSKYLERMAREATMPEEELEEKKRRRQEYHRRRYEGMTEEDRERRRRNLKRWRDNMDAERKQRISEKLREYYQRRKERMKEENPNRTWRVRRPSVPRGDGGEVKRRRRRRNNGGEYLDVEDEEQKQRRLLHRRLNAAKCNLRSRLRKRGVPEEEIEVRVRRLEENYEHKPSRRNVEETEEEKKERIRKQRSLTQKKINLRRKLELQKLLQSGLSIEEAKGRLESPEKRERTLLKQRIKWRRANLRKRLEQSGASPEEIQLRVQELEQTYQPTYNFRPYRPRPDTWKPIDPNDLALLSDSPNPVNLDLKSYYSSVSSSSPSTSKSKKVTARSTSTPKKSTSPTTRRCPGRPPKSSPQPSTSQFQPQPTPSYPPPPLTPAPYHFQIAPSNHSFYSQTPAAHQNHFQVHYHSSPGGGSYSQQQPDYTSSYDDTDNHSHPPASPPCGGDDLDDNDYSSSFGGDYSTQNTYHSPSIHPIDYTAAPRKDGKPRKIRKGIPNPKKARFGPRGLFKKSLALPDTAKVNCDLCGNHYPSSYLLKHKNLHHNPNYQNQGCMLCGEKFTVASLWYAHYNKEHGGNPVLKKNVPSADKPHMCDDCGASFSRKNALQLHKYQMHGDGLKKENYQRCPICPNDKMFKTVISLDVHLRNKHVEYWKERMRVECSRCEERFRTELALARHVKECHPESYFPCGYCEGVRFSKVAREFHWTECKKVGRERKEEMRTKEGIIGFGGERLECEFCGRCVRVSSMTRHYEEIHGVKEEGGFTCVWCGRGFKRREFWGVHMEEMHGRGMDEVRDMVRRWSRVEREGVEVRNVEGCFGGLKREEEVDVEGIKVKRKVERRVIRRRGGGRVLVIAEEDEEEEEELVR